MTRIILGKYIESIDESLTAGETALGKVWRGIDSQLLTASDLTHPLILHRLPS